MSAEKKREMEDILNGTGSHTGSLLAEISDYLRHAYAFGDNPLSSLRKMFPEFRWISFPTQVECADVPGAESELEIGTKDFKFFWMFEVGGEDAPQYVFAHHSKITRTRILGRRATKLTPQQLEKRDEFTTAKLREKVGEQCEVVYL
jgi:hypothetical protein